jgi:type II secretory pathway pseudopilin PulG
MENAMNRAQQRSESDRGRDLRNDPCGAKCAHRPRRSREGGYALLFVLFLTAVLAVTLTRALPQIAMQSQRVREERLIYRGEQYKRAIQLYFRKYKKYPSSIDDLEETNGLLLLVQSYLLLD